MQRKQYFIAPSSQAISDYNGSLSSIASDVAKRLSSVGVNCSVFVAYGAWEGELEPSLCIDVISNDDKVFYWAEFIIKDYKIDWRQQSVLVVNSQVSIAEL